MTYCPSFRPNIQVTEELERLLYGSLQLDVQFFSHHCRNLLEPGGLGANLLFEPEDSQAEVEVEPSRINHSFLEWICFRF